MANREITIGKLAKVSGVNVETIRYYQRLGLVEEPLKPREGFRRYPPETAARIIFIKRAKKLGFTLKEIKELLELGDGHCADMRTRAEEKRSQVAAQIRDLELLRKTLDELIAACVTGREDAHCPIVESLADTTPDHPRSRQ